MIWVGSARFIFSQALKLTTCWAWVPSYKSWRTKPSKMFENCLIRVMTGERIQNVSRVCCGCGAVWTPVCKTQKFPKTGEIETATNWVCGLRRIDEDWRLTQASAQLTLQCCALAVPLCVLSTFLLAWLGPQRPSSHNGSWFTLHTLPNEKLEKTWEDVDKQSTTWMILYDT